MFAKNSRNLFKKAVNIYIPLRRPLDPKGEYGPWGKYIENSLLIMSVISVLSCCYKIYEQGPFLNIPKN